MTADHIERAFGQHPDFERADDDQFETPGKPFPGVVTVGFADGDDAAQCYHVEVRTPMLDAVVESEDVAEVVEDGWFETLELRLDDAHTVTDAETAAPPEIERKGDEVVLTAEFESEDPERAAEDALAIVEFVEGTWVQGIIPGYEYGEPAASLRQRARQSYDGGGDGNSAGRDGANRGGGDGSR
jgi:hypothetical protein